jgi:hypothetical protein
MKHRIFAWFVPVLAVSVLTGCTDFFSTSLASWTRRDADSLIPPVTTGNIDDLLKQTEKDSDASLALLKKIRDAGKNASGDEAAALQLAALKAASNATKPVESLMKNGGDLQNIDPANAEELITNAINDMPNLSSTGDLLTEIIPDPDTNPDEFQAFVDAADPLDLATAAVMILMASDAVDSGDPVDYITNYTPGSSPLAEALAKAAQGKGNETVDGLLSNMHLT